jgi:Asp-tRNA(Asn)/Glu-tRNA(Gln) amidotransferase B subunit
LKLAQNKKVKANKIANLLVNKKLKKADTPQATLEAFIKATATADVSSDEIAGFVKQALDANPDAVAKYQAGQTQLINFLLGQVMRIAKKKLDPQQVKAELEKALA